MIFSWHQSKYYFRVHFGGAFGDVFCSCATAVLQRFTISTCQYHNSYANVNIIFHLQGGYHTLPRQHSDLERWLLAEKSKWNWKYKGQHFTSRSVTMSAQAHILIYKILSKCKGWHTIRPTEWKRGNPNKKSLFCALNFTKYKSDEWKTV